MAEAKEPAKKKEKIKKAEKANTTQTGNKTPETKEVKENDSDGDVSSASTVISVEDNAADKSGTQIGTGVQSAAATVDREEYLQAHRDLTFDKSQQQMKNNLLHRRLAEYYKKRKLDHVLKPLEGAIDLEDKYQQKLLSYENLKEKSEKEIADIQETVHKVELQYADRLEYAESKFDGLQTLEKSTGTGLIYSKKGKPIADKTIIRFLTLQRRKQEQASALCLRYVRARNAVAELDAIIRKLEMLGPDLYVAQYEQLAIDNQNYMTKIEEREDELIRNRSKCTEHNQILAHIREKMHHTDEVIDLAEIDLGDADFVYSTARERLAVVKNRRDKLRWSLEDEKLKAGLLTRKDLLRDYQDATDEVIKLRERKEFLKEQIIKVKYNLAEFRRRLQKARDKDQNKMTATAEDSA